MDRYTPNPEANVGIENAYTKMVEAALDPTKAALRPDLHAMIIANFGKMAWGQREALVMHPYWDNILSSAAHSPDGANGLVMDEDGRRAHAEVVRIISEHSEDPLLDKILKENGDRIRQRMQQASDSIDGSMSA